MLCVLPASAKLVDGVPAWPSPQQLSSTNLLSSCPVRVQLGSLSRQAARVPTLLGELEQAQDDLREVRGLLVETQNAFKLLMGTVQEKEVEAEAAEAQAVNLGAAVEAARRQQDETAAELEVGGEQIQSGGAAGGINGGGLLSLQRAPAVQAASSTPLSAICLLLRRPKMLRWAACSESCRRCGRRWLAGSSAATSCRMGWMVGIWS